MDLKQRVDWMQINHAVSVWAAQKLSKYVLTS